MRIDSPGILKGPMLWVFTTIWPLMSHQILFPAAVVGLFSGREGRWLMFSMAEKWEVGNSGVSEKLGHRNVIISLIVEEFSD